MGRGRGTPTSATCRASEVPPPSNHRKVVHVRGEAGEEAGEIPGEQAYAWWGGDWEGHSQGKEFKEREAKRARPMSSGYACPQS